MGSIRVYTQIPILGAYHQRRAHTVQRACWWIIRKLVWPLTVLCIYTCIHRYTDRWSISSTPRRYCSMCCLHRSSYVKPSQSCPLDEPAEIQTEPPRHARQKHGEKHIRTCQKSRRGKAAVPVVRRGRSIDMWVSCGSMSIDMYGMWARRDERERSRCRGLL